MNGQQQRGDGRRRDGGRERREGLRGTRYTGISFEQEMSSDGKGIWVFPPDKARADGPTKRLRLEEGQFIPQIGRTYEVEVVRETKKGNPNRGVAYVKLISENGVPMEEIARREEDERARREAEKKLFEESPVYVDWHARKAYILDVEIDLPDAAMPPRSEREGDERGAWDQYRAPENKYYVLDAHTMKVMKKIAIAYANRSPLLLEGDTGVSKTSAVLKFAEMLGLGVLRFNGGPNVDAGELIGKYMPNDGQLAIEFDQLLRDMDRLSPASREIVASARDSGRSLSQVESARIAQAEGIDIPEWVWQDGVLPQAMEKGLVLICDEYNANEGSVRERINSALELNPTLRMDEHRGEEFAREGGDRTIHEGFWVVACVNPADEFGNRDPFSPAERDRFTERERVPRTPGESYAAMAKLLVYGEQPELLDGADTYKMPNQEPIPDMQEMGQIEGMREFLGRFADFHAAISDKAHERGIGKDYGEKYTFTRRGFHGFLQYLGTRSKFNRRTRERKTIMSHPSEIALEAINHYYLDRMRNAGDKQVVESMLSQNSLSAHSIRQLFLNHERQMRQSGV